MAFDDPGVVTGLELAALEGRRLQASLLVHDGDAVSARAGVLHGLGVSVAGLTVSVAAGSAVLSPGTGSNGSYLVVNAAQVDLTAVAQHATLARIDRVICRVYDTEVDGSGFSKAEVQIVAGTPAALPVAPALPAGAFELDQLQVPATGSPIVVVDKRSFTAAVGGVITVATTAELPTGSFLRPGQPAFTTNYGVRWVWSGTAWRPINALFADTTARDAAIPSPLVGDRCTLTSGAEYRCLVAAAWVLWSCPWTSYTPVVTGATGIGAPEGRYRVSAGAWDVEFQFGTTGAITGSPVVSMPVALKSFWVNSPLGIGVLVDTSSGNRYALLLVATAENSSTVSVNFTAQATGILTAVSAAAPFTIANTDRVYARVQGGAL